MHGAREGRKRDRGKERAREREREREREKGRAPNGLWCPWSSMARLMLPLVPWLESAVHTC